MLNLSSLKLLSGVFFALFVLSACGGGGGGAAAPAAADSVAQTCEQQGLFDNNGTCVAAIDASTCDSMQATDNNLCLPVLDPNDTSVNNCGVTFYYNSSTNTCDTKLVAANCTADQTLNASLNACVTNISGGATCDSATEFTRIVGAVNTCEPLVVAADCDSGAVTDNKCSAVTASICASMQVNPADNTACLPASVETCTTTNGFYYNAADTACDISVEASSCGIDETHNAGMNYCGATTNLTAAHFQGNSDSEYYESNVLDGVKAAEAYANISTLAATMPTIKQGGAGQIVSIASNLKFRTSHQEFGANGAAFESVYDATKGKLYTDTTATTATYTSGTDITDTAKGNCPGGCIGSQYAAVIAGRKGGTGMHGIAYNAKLRAIIGTSADLVNIIPAGVDADIIAMNHAWTDVSSVGAPATIDGTELTAWKAAVSDTDPATDGNQNTNKTIMVFSSDNDGYNSENGSQGVANGNHPKWRAIYPTLEPDLNVGRWLVVTGLNNADGKINSGANGCGVAIKFCLASFVTAGTISAAGFSNNQYQEASNVGNASSTVAGGLAVLKGAFPNITPENLSKLVLETSDYIELDNMEPCGATEVNANCTLADTNDFKPLAGEETTNRMEVTNLDGSTRYINPVYGYGKLNLETATTPNTVSSYVTASNNESIGALWQDTKLTLSSHFGGNFESVTFGIGDAYGRHFITNAPQTSYAPIAVSLDDYMANMLADNVQSQRLGGQAQANYSNTGEQSWMNLEYISGKATTKIAFQDSYKINPLSDTGTTTILRANNIRPASTNIGMMDVDYKLGNLTLSSYVARGEYDTGYKFDELGTDFDVNYKDSHLNIAIGNIREHGQFLGTNTSGAYALNAPSISRFTDVTYGHDLGAKFNLYANYINYETDVDMLHDQFASIDNLQADQYQIGFTGKDLISKDDSLKIALITKLGVTDGALNQNTVLGYTADGAFNNASQSYDLAVNQRHQQFEITYQGKLYQNADKVSALRDNRFFTSIIVDQNLNHVQGASQVEVVSGINIRY